jgi:hypothetical protein
MRPILFFLLIIFTPKVFSSTDDKFIFQNEKSCTRCLKEIKGKSGEGKTRYSCRPKNSSRPEKDYFIIKSHFSTESMEFLKIIEKNDYREKSGKKKRSFTKEQKGLTEKDIRKLCPETYRQIKK